MEKSCYNKKSKKDSQVRTTAARRRSRQPRKPEKRRDQVIMIKQNIVFVENRAGSLQKVTALLSDSDINIYGFACFDAPEFALFRMVCDAPEKAGRVLTENGYMNRLTNVIVVDMKDETGSLNEFLSVLGESNVNLDYIYTSYHRKSQIPVVILQSEEIFETESVLRSNGFKLLGDVKELEK